MTGVVGVIEFKLIDQVVDSDQRKTQTQTTIYRLHRFLLIVAYTQKTLSRSLGIKRSSSSAPEKKTNFPLSADFFSYRAHTKLS